MVLIFFVVNRIKQVLECVWINLLASACLKGGKAGKHKEYGTGMSIAFGQLKADDDEYIMPSVQVGGHLGSDPTQSVQPTQYLEEGTNTPRLCRRRWRRQQSVQHAPLLFCTTAGWDLTWPLGPGQCELAAPSS